MPHDAQTPTGPDGITVVANDVARERVQRVLHNFFDEVDAWHRNDTATPPQHLIQISVGGGKSSVTRACVAARLGTDANDANDATMAMRRGVIAVPTHDLATEYAARLHEAGVAAMVWRGRDARGPDGAAACHNLDAVHDAQRAGVSVESRVCRRRFADGTEIHCPFYDRCLYQRQKTDARAANVVVVPHAALFRPKPEAIGEVNWLVIDEDFVHAGLRGTDTPTRLTRDALTQPPSPDVYHDMVDRARLGAVVERLQEGLRGINARSEAIPLAPIRAAGLDSAAAREAMAIENRAQVDADLRPDLDAHERQQRAEAAAEVNAPLRKRARFWRLLAEALAADVSHAGGIWLDHVRAEAGPAQAFRLLSSADIATGWPEATVYLDATPRADLAGRFLPHLEEAERLAIAAPNMRVVQVPDAPSSKNKLAPDTARRACDATTAWNHLRDVHARVQALARGEDDRRLLLVAQKPVTDALATFPWRPNVTFAHFNALRGLNAWADVGTIVVLGRPLPPPQAIEQIHGALFNRVPGVTPSEPDTREQGRRRLPWYDKVAAHLHHADGTATPVETEAHPDATCEAIRRSICEDELMQAIGRGRGVNRTADQPLTVHVFSRVVLPIQVECDESWEATSPGPRDRQLAHGIAVDNARHAAALHPDAGSHEAARKRRQRARTGTNASWNDHEANVPVLRRGRYRVSGKGRQPGAFMVDPAMVPEPEALLTARLGPLAFCEYREDRAIGVD